KWTARGTCGAIVLVIVFWITLRFVGPGLGWWSLAD
ncbi:MAG: DUF2839 family protein, partial [Nodosilinea sp.]